MANTCPFLKEECYERYYCQFKEDYINTDHYNSYCRGLCVPDYLKCSIYESFESANLYVGYTMCLDNSEPERHAD